MADPLLTSLCTICHTQAPKYKCPRCQAKTCSLSCVKKHKNWSSCNGERDPTIFIPREKLRTEAGIDHDYNFLTKIERSVELADKILREEREIIPQNITLPPPNKRARLHKGKSRGKTTLENSTKRWDRNSFQRMRTLGIYVSCLPYGMTRSKENRTTWNKRTGTMNWQIEWLELEQDEKPKRRILHKILDETPLYIGYKESRNYHRYWQLGDDERAEERKASRYLQKSGDMEQDVRTTAWRTTPCSMQDQTAGAWNRSAEDEQEMGRYKFFFQKPNTPSNEPCKLIPLEPTDQLATLLPGLEIIEFPTIYVLPSYVVSLPYGYILEERPKTQKERKRKRAGLVEYASSNESSSDAEDGGSVEQGPEDGEVLDDTTSSSGSE
ncbi:hypothetical protein F4778DRAFT_771787 [Xylariomycetidae sp. FL2044]|nr:hypothetical protein F4778DRAFT_771787 [Xylariomycetidae sp. FL2044]